MSESAQGKRITLEEVLQTLPVIHHNNLAEKDGDARGMKPCQHELASLCVLNRTNRLRKWVRCLEMGTDVLAGVLYFGFVAWTLRYIFHDEHVYGFKQVLGLQTSNLPDQMD